MIKVEHLVKRYGNRNVVDDLTFTVEKGQIVGFLGPNGAGKSTTMNMITGYISATEGTIEIDGVDIFDEPEKAKKKIGYLPEMPPLYPDMLVREYLSFVCDIKKVKRDKKDAMISKVMRRAKITDVSERLIKNLSKGYKQRVGIAGAMVGDPEILIFDDSFSALDFATDAALRKALRENTKDMTVIIVTQRCSTIKNADLILVLDDGRLVGKGPHDELFESCETYREICLSQLNEEEAKR